MRNWLKYNSSSTDADVQKNAAEAQAVWSSCRNPSGRKMCLESFQKDKSKNLDWVRTFHEECEHSENMRNGPRRGTSQFRK
eukprot:5749118-Pyramimonas_sp.AAC.1